MKKIVLLAMAVILAGTLWGCAEGQEGDDYGWGTAMDSSGNVYAVGHTGGAFSGQTSTGGPDAFVAKYNGAGNQIWVRQFGTSS